MQRLYSRDIQLYRKMKLDHTIHSIKFGDIVKSYSFLRMYSFFYRLGSLKLFRLTSKMQRLFPKTLLKIKSKIMNIISKLSHPDSTLRVNKPSLFTNMLWHTQKLYFFIKNVAKKLIRDGLHILPLPNEPCKHGLFNEEKQFLSLFSLGCISHINVALCYHRWGICSFRNGELSTAEDDLSFLFYNTS